MASSTLRRASLMTSRCVCRASRAVSPGPLAMKRTAPSGCSPSRGLRRRKKARTSSGRSARAHIRRKGRRRRGGVGALDAEQEVAPGRLPPPTVAVLVGDVHAAEPRDAVVHAGAACGGCGTGRARAGSGGRGAPRPRRPAAAPRRTRASSTSPRRRRGPSPARPATRRRRGDRDTPGRCRRRRRSTSRGRCWRARCRPQRTWRQRPRGRRRRGADRSLIWRRLAARSSTVHQAALRRLVAPARAERIEELLNSRRIGCRPRPADPVAAADEGHLAQGGVSPRENRHARLARCARPPRAHRRRRRVRPPRSRRRRDLWRQRRRCRLRCPPAPAAAPPVPSRCCGW